MNCKIIQDLLPLYHDGVCSSESRELVEEHLQECPDCKDVLHTLDEEISLANEVDAAKPMVNIRNRLKQIRWQALVRGAVTATLVIALLIGAWWTLTQWHFIPIGSEDLQVVRVAQLDNGRIACELGMLDDEDGFGYYRYTLSEDGKLYITPFTSILTVGKEWEYAFLQTDSDHLTGLPGIPKDSKATAFYFGAPEDCILIWEEGMELPVMTEAEFYKAG